MWLALYVMAVAVEQMTRLGMHLPNPGLKKVPILFLTFCETYPTLGTGLGEQSPLLIDIVNMCSPDGAEIIRKKAKDACAWPARGLAAPRGRMGCGGLPGLPRSGALDLVSAIAIALALHEIMRSRPLAPPRLNSNGLPLGRSSRQQ
jgi:hypothetical protein